MKKFLLILMVLLLHLPAAAFAHETLVIAWPHPNLSLTGVTRATLNAETLEVKIDDKAEIRSNGVYTDIIEPLQGVTYIHTGTGEYWEAHFLAWERLDDFATKDEVTTKFTNWKNTLWYEDPDTGATYYVNAKHTWTIDIEEMEQQSNWEKVTQ